MRIFALIGQSLRALSRNIFRTFLTTLGIIIGVASVVSLVAIGQGVSNSVSEQFDVLGAAKISVNSAQIVEEEEEEVEAQEDTHGLGIMPAGGGPGKLRNFMSEPSLTVEDLDTIKDLDDVSVVSPVVSHTYSFTLNDEDYLTSISGVTNDYFGMESLNFVAGEGLDMETEGAKEVVLGTTVADQVVDDMETDDQEYSYNDLIGKAITMNDEDSYTIVGVVEKDEETMGRFTDPNDAMYMDYVEVMEYFEIEKISTIELEATSEEVVSEVSDNITTALLSNHDIDDPESADFFTFSSQDILSAKDEVFGFFTSMLAGIASISLLVGGIGIMNIMLVNVTERTREIGLRKAVGAKTGEIMVQFLIESILITVAGGILGVAAGYGLGEVFRIYADISPSFDITSILLAVGISAGIGVIFGAYPAWKAARMDPVMALRYE